MKDGWETKRSRRPGFDWAVVRLGTRGIVTRAEIDTSHFKGNFPDAASLEACDAPGAELRSLTDAPREWRPLLPVTKLHADTRHVFEKELAAGIPATHVRLRIYPDGGVSRLRLFGTPHLSGWLARLNVAEREDVLSMLASCCGCRSFSRKWKRRGPSRVTSTFCAPSTPPSKIFFPRTGSRRFAAHPRLGDRGAAGRAASEQAMALAASPAILEALRDANAAYEKRFGFVFIACAAGVPADSLLAGLNDRLANPTDLELRIAADEQRKITRLRIEKLLVEGT